MSIRDLARKWKETDMTGGRRAREEFLEACRSDVTDDPFMVLGAKYDLLVDEERVTGFTWEIFKKRKNIRQEIFRLLQETEPEEIAKGDFSEFGPNVQLDLEDW